ncbi:protein GVQW3 [Camponotus floridanus]|uniref:protein GVQW3 n=1 Tax=Camponotus floridanus TaxID=104421 RepID=UPI000DC6B6E1|nr:protein GVQW3 [Camponotus floridanus]
MLTAAFGEFTLSKKNVYKWYKLFTESREDVNDDARPGRPSTSTTDDNVEAVKKIVMENRRITIREVAEDVGILVGSCHAIFLGVLGMQRVAAKFVPKLLNFDQKQRRVDIAQELLNAVNDDPDLLKRVITGDESWVYGYDVEIKA